MRKLIKTIKKIKYIGTGVVAGATGTVMFLLSYARRHNL